MAPSRGTVDGHEYVLYDNGLAKIYIRSDDGTTALGVRVKQGEDALARIRDKLNAQFADARTRTTAMPSSLDPELQGGPPAATAPDHSPPRKRSRRNSLPIDLHSPSVAWGSYDRGRVGDRHERKREYSYKELDTLFGIIRPYLVTLVQAVPTGGAAAAAPTSPAEAAAQAPEAQASLAARHCHDDDFAARAVEALFTQAAVPNALPFKGSSQVHMSVGMCDDDDEALRNGPLTWSRYFCGCAACTRLAFNECQMKEVFGTVKTASVKRANATGLQTMTDSLEEFCKTLQRDSIVALRVANDEVDIEGQVWLALINSKPRKLEEQVLQQGQIFEKGFIVVDAQCFSYAGEGAEQEVHAAHRGGAVECEPYSASQECHLRSAICTPACQHIPKPPAVCPAAAAGYIRESSEQRGRQQRMICTRRAVIGGARSPSDERVARAGAL